MPSRWSKLCRIFSLIVIIRVTSKLVDMFDFLYSGEIRRKKMFKHAPEGPLKIYLSAPLPDYRSNIYSAPLLALDFETTGLNASEDSILSVGTIAIDGGEIRLSTASHQLVKSSAALVEDNVVIHKITDDVSLTGEELEVAIGALLQRLAGNVMLVHHAKIEISFLKEACKKLYGINPEFPVIDTLNLARQWYANRNKEISPNDLRLLPLRDQYGLPCYTAHDALSDALATAELFLAQVEHMDSKAPFPLSRFLS